MTATHNLTPKPYQKIVLLRHGRPKIGQGTWLNAAEFRQWAAAYDNADIDTDFLPPETTLKEADTCAFTVCSPLPRSTGSAKLLALEGLGLCDMMFREMDMPYANWRYPRLPPNAWGILLRLAWLLGYCANAESFGAARARARRCAVRLVGLASGHGSVLFVGHGLLNWFIARHLKRMGWVSAKNSPSEYWEFAIYRPLPSPDLPNT